MNICFFGPGGVGGYFGALFTRHFEGDKNVSVHFIARGKHKDAIIKSGLTLKSEENQATINIRPDSCTDTADHLPVCDVIVLAVKSYDLAEAAKKIDRIAGKDTIILPLLNGVDIYDRVRKSLKNGYVLPACVYIGAYIDAPGIVVQKGGSCQIIMGKDPQHPEFLPGRLLSMFRNSGIKYVWHEDARAAIWTKYMFVAPYSLVTAAYNKTIGEIMADEELGNITRTITRETEKIARGLNIPLSAGIANKSFNKGRLFPFGATTSFQRDIEQKGARNEGDLFGGTLIRYAEKLEIDIPEIRKTYKILQRQMSEKHGLK